MHWTGDYWCCNSKDTSCDGEISLVQWEMTLLNAYWEETLIEHQLGKLNLCYKRKAHTMTSKQWMCVIDLVINLSCTLCACASTHTSARVPECLKSLSVHTWIRLLVFNCGVPQPTSISPRLPLYWLPNRTNTQVVHTGREAVSLVAGRLWSLAKYFLCLVFFFDSGLSIGW